MNQISSPDESASLTASTMKVDAISVPSNRIRHDLGDIEQLAQNIATIGLLHQVVVTVDGMLFLAGARRLAAIKHLGWKEVPVTILVQQ
jgi:ParB-like chromosome segregation protein Spo0J